MDTLVLPDHADLWVQAAATLLVAAVALSSAILLLAVPAIERRLRGAAANDNEAGYAGVRTRLRGV